MSKIWIKMGVHGDLQPEAAEGFRRYCRFHEQQGWGDVYLTCVRDGSHLVNSYHPWGRAFDIRPPTTITEDITRRILEVMGPGWSVLDEGHHWHFQLRWPV